MGKRKERDSHEDSIITENLDTDSSYTVECRNGLRSIQPYFFTFTVHAKRRWLGRRLVDVFQTEYRDRSAAYYAHAIEIGRIRVNGQQVSKTYIVCDNDTITHRVHRHEPCVTAQPPVVLYQDEQMVVIDKPASIPVHPTGRFRYNTIVSIMKRDYQLDVRPLHRLDRLTSGVLLLGRTDGIPISLQTENLKHKEYIARVKGSFPYTDITVDQPLLCINHKLALNSVSEQGKPAQTRFEAVPASFNGRTSLVKCFPRTGRTHQIRVHLQYLGHPIANDPLYANPIVDEGAEQGGEENSVPINDCKLHPKFKLPCNEDEKVLADDLHPNSDSKTDNEHAHSLQLQDPSLCSECLGFEDNAPPPGLNDLCIWLHACVYASAEWRFEAPLPAWARIDWQELE